MLGGGTQALDNCQASPIFMLPGLPRMMLILDLVRRRQTTFVALTLERLDHGGGET